MLRVRLISRIDELEALSAQWDELAVAAGRPYATPAWLLAWWRCARPPTARLRTPIVLDGDQLVGIMPCFVQHERPGFVEYRLLGAGSAHRIDPSVRAGLEGEVIALVARELSTSEPSASTLRLEGLDASSPWPAMLREGWSGRLRPWIHHGVVQAAPVLSLTPPGETTWLESKSKNFRQYVRRMRRRLSERGAAIRMVTDAGEFDDAIDHLVRVHHERWAGRGGSRALGAQEQALLRDAGPTLLEADRLRLWVIEAEGRIVAATMCVATGGTVAAWAGGFEDEWARFSPETLLLAAAVEDSFSRGESIFDLGGGGDAYKQRFADGDVPVAWFTLFPRGLRYPLARAHTLPRHTFWRARAIARRHLSPAAQERLKRLLGR